jgi:hypothetical protein
MVNGCFTEEKGDKPRVKRGIVEILAVLMWKCLEEGTENAKS